MKTDTDKINDRIIELLEEQVETLKEQVEILIKENVILKLK